MSKVKPSPLLPDTVIGGYRVVRRISAGGFGVVYLAVDHSGQQVAIKHFEGGVQALGDTCLPLITNPVAREAYQNIALKFAELDGYGPQTVTKFLVESNATEGMNAAQIAQDAFGQVQAWITSMGLIRK
jgi:serine/threonine protein kinase